jgi:hypothetical protein
MKKPFSYLMHVMAWLSVLVTICSTFSLVNALSEARSSHESIGGWTALAYVILFGCVGGGTLLFAIIPSSLLYSSAQRRLDLISVCLASGSFLVAIAELLWTLSIPPTGGG